MAGSIRDAVGARHGARRRAQPLRLQPALSQATRVAAVMLVAAVAAGVFVVLAFGWSVGGTVAGGAAGAVLWGLMHFLTDSRRYVPRGAVPAPPPEAELAGTRRWTALLWALLWLPLVAAVAYLVEALGLGPLFVPGQIAGYGAASAVLAVLIARWERRHARRLVTGLDADGDVRRYAVDRPAPARAERSRDQAAGAAANPTGTTSGPPAGRRSGG